MEWEGGFRDLDSPLLLTFRMMLPIFKASSPKLIRANVTSLALIVSRLPVGSRLKGVSIVREKILSSGLRFQCYSVVVRWGTTSLPSPACPCAMTCSCSAVHPAGSVHTMLPSPILLDHSLIRRIDSHSPTIACRN